LEHVTEPFTREEFDELIVDPVGRFLMQDMAGRERLGIDKVARVFPPHGADVKTK